MHIYKSHRRHEQGLALIAAVILFVLFLVFIGTLAYVLWRAIQNLPKNGSSHEALAIEDYHEKVNELTLATQHEFGTTNVTPLYLTGIQKSNIIVFLPFGTNAYDAILERSTNRIDWEQIDTQPAGEAFIDMSPPPPPASAFYRRLYLNVTGPVIEDTNHVPGFYYLPQ